MVDYAFDRKRNRYAILRKAMQKIGRAIERVDDPLIIRIHFGLAGLLGKNAMLGIGLSEHLDDGGFCSAIYLRNEVVGRFQLNGELVQIVGGAANDRARTARRFDGDI